MNFYSISKVQLKCPFLKQSFLIPPTELVHAFVLPLTTPHCDVLHIRLPHWAMTTLAVSRVPAPSCGRYGSKILNESAAV